MRLITLLSPAGQGYNNFGSGNYVYYIANSSGGTDFGNIDIAEILFYNVFLNATDMKKVQLLSER
jgi:hypothetical protein